MDDTADRLAWLQKQDPELGTSLSDAARGYGIHYETYKKVARGNRPLAKDDAETIAQYHGISPGWLMFGEGTPRGELSIEVAGFIGAGQQVTLFDDVGEQKGRTDALISGPDAHALEVRGDSMFPLAHDGDVIFVAAPSRDVQRLIGYECAVQLHDGRRFFKILERGSREGLFDLRSYNAEPMRDLEIHSAGAFIGVRRRAAAPVQHRRRRVNS